MKIEKLCPHCMKEVEFNEQNSCPLCGYNRTGSGEAHHQLKPYTILAGKYLVGDVLGEGGFGITYVGFDLNLEMRVAIKEFYPSGYATREADATSALTIYTGKNKEYVEKWRDNFIREARMLAKCSHLSGIVGVKDFFQENNTAYIVMEYLEGITLKEYAKSRGEKLPVQQLITSLEPVMVSLCELHNSGTIHRDISPDNIMVLPGGAMKLLDFGAARDYAESGERSLSVMLKPGYAPEEQYRTKGKQGPWTDVYALAGTIYKCITGVTPPEAMERLREDELKKLGELGVFLPPETEAALLKGLEVYAENRYQTMEEFQQNLCRQVGETSKADAESAEVIEQSEDHRNKQQLETSEAAEVRADSGIKRKPVAILLAVLVLCCACAVLLLGRGSGNSPSSTAPAEDTRAVELLEAARQAAQSGEYTIAVAYCEEARILDTQNEEAYLLEADLYLLQDNPQEAMRVLREGLEATDSEKLKERRESVRENTKVITEEHVGASSNYNYTQYVYDSRGNRTEAYYTNIRGKSPVQGRIWEYDGEGRVVEETQLPDDNSPGYSISYKYDTRGNLISEISNSSSMGMSGRIDHEYDDAGNRINTVYYDGYGMEYRIIEYEYDRGGNKIRQNEETLGNDGNTYYEDSEYDTMGNITKYVTDERWEEYTNEYDSAGNLIRQTLSNGGGMHWTSTPLEEMIGNKVEYEYDSAGNMIRKVVIENDAVISDTKWSYDELGNCIYEEEVSVFDSGIYTESSFQYEYFGEILSL